MYAYISNIYQEQYFRVSFQFSSNLVLINNSFSTEITQILFTAIHVYIYTHVCISTKPKNNNNKTLKICCNMKNYYWKITNESGHNVPVNRWIKQNKEAGCSEFKYAINTSVSERWRHITNHLEKINT